MTSKRNEFLDGDDEEEELIHDSDAEEDSRFKAFSAKRRKLDRAHQEDESSEEDHKEVEGNLSSKSKSTGTKKKNLDDASQSSNGPPKPNLKPLTPAQLAASQRKARKTGVIYISKVPPFMKPSTIRRLLSPYGTILRLFLTPEPSPAYTKRVRSGGNKKRSFIDGWVEFASKTRAKICAETLNSNIIGGKKGGWYHDDLWNMKYLRGFKWADLMEQVQGEERLREGRLRAELQKEAKERKAFLGNMELAKRERTMEAKRRKKDEKEGNLKGDPPDSREMGAAESGISVKPSHRTEMRFRQNEVSHKTMQKPAPGETDYAKSVLSKIF